MDEIFESGKEFVDLFELDFGDTPFTFSKKYFTVTKELHIFYHTKLIVVVDSVVSISSLKIISQQSINISILFLGCSSYYRKTFSQQKYDNISTILSLCCDDRLFMINTLIKFYDMGIMIKPSAYNLINYFAHDYRNGF